MHNFFETMQIPEPMDGAEIHTLEKWLYLHSFFATSGSYKLNLIALTVRPTAHGQYFRIETHSHRRHLPVSLDDYHIH